MKTVTGKGQGLGLAVEYSVLAATRKRSIYRGSFCVILNLKQEVHGSRHLASMLDSSNRTPFWWSMRLESVYGPDMNA